MQWDRASRIIEVLFVGLTLLLSLRTQGTPTYQMLEVSPLWHEGNPQAGQLGLGGYLPPQIRHAYGFDRVSASGTPAIIGVVVAYGSPTIQKDFAMFNEYYRLSPASLQIFYPTGQPTEHRTEWSSETALDVEWAHALAPTAHLLLVVAKTQTIADLLSGVDFAVARRASVIVMSWGRPEFRGEADMDVHFSQPGTLFVAAAGDRGTQVLWPAVSSKVVAVGGTSLLLDLAGNRLSPEEAWKWSGGGISRFISQPGYQVSASDRTDGQRGVPDLAFFADSDIGVTVYTTSGTGRGWVRVGGTSLAAVGVAAALSFTIGRGNEPPKEIHPKLYALASGSTYQDYFRDVTVGSNGDCGQVCAAARGYDLVTGLGSPRVNEIVSSLRPLSALCLNPSPCPL